MDPIQEDRISSSKKQNDHVESSQQYFQIRSWLRGFQPKFSLVARFNLFIIPTIIVISIASAVIIQHQRKIAFDQQINQLHNTFSNISHDQSAFNQEAHRIRRERITTYLLEISKVPLLNKDHKLLKNITTTAVKARLISYAAFFSANNLLITDTGKPASHLRLKRHTIRANGKTLGYLVIGISNLFTVIQNSKIEVTAENQVALLRDFLAEVQASNRVAALISILFILCSIIILTTYIFRKFVHTPLSRCISIMKLFHAREYGVQVPYRDQHDEIGEIARSLDTFRSTLIEMERIEQEAELQNDQLVNAKARAERLAYVDELTNLPNRSCCKLDALEILSNADENACLALLYLDLNDFKKVNDTLGHSAGDCLLSEVGKRLGMLSRSKNNCRVYRWGGDEFVLIYDRSNGSTEGFCEEINDTLGMQLRFGSHTLWPSGSIGVAKFPEDGSDFESLMINADLALHKTKQNGSSYHFFTRKLKQKVDDETRIENELRIAIEEKQLFLVYQPQVDSKTQKVRGIEALIRWRHPERGVLTPYHFLDVIEDSRLAPIVGAYVFDEAFRAARSWLDQGLDFGRIAVNLSPKHLKHGTLIHDLNTAMNNYVLGAQYVSVEVLESLLIDNNDEQQQEFIALLNSMNVHIELDDFGTGYASLSHLSTLPIDALKIDRSFTNQILTDDKKAIVIQSLLSLTKLLQIELVCEGVETASQLDKIRTYGECALQGYLISKPMEFNMITEWLQEEKNLTFLDGIEESLDEKSA